MLLEKDFNYHKLNIKEWFIKRGYPESIIDKEMKKACFSEYFGVFLPTL